MSVARAGNRTPGGGQPAAAASVWALAMAVLGAAARHVAAACPDRAGCISDRGGTDGPGHTTHRCDWRLRHSCRGRCTDQRYEQRACRECHKDMASAAGRNPHPAAGVGCDLRRAACLARGREPAAAPARHRMDTRVAAGPGRAGQRRHRAPRWSGALHPRIVVPRWFLA